LSDRGIVGWGIFSAGAGRFQQVAMGQGQAEKAMSLLRQCATNGDWLCLKNVHLVVAWLPTFEKELNSLLPKAHESFRCAPFSWLDDYISCFSPSLSRQIVVLVQTLHKTGSAEWSR
jgi:hypothetical protein